MTGQWDIAVLDLARVIGLDADGDGNITHSELEAKRAEIERYGLSREKIRRRKKIYEKLLRSFLNPSRFAGVPKGELVIRG